MKHINTFFSKKNLLMQLILIVLFIFICGKTYAYLYDKEIPIENTFKQVQVSSSIVNVDNELKIQNTSDIPVFIRAAIVVTWQNSQGDIYSALPVLGSDYIITPMLPNELNNGWIYGPDGYYYWTEKVQPSSIDINNCYTGNLFNSYQVLESANIPTDYSLHIEVVAEAFQAVPEREVEEAWGNSDVKLKVNDGRLTFVSP